MKTCWLLIMVIGLCSSITSFGQIFNTNNGDWSVSGNWTPSGVPTGQTTAVTISQNVIVSTDLRTAAGTQGIGTVTVANNTNITVNSGGFLEIGSPGQYPGTPESLDYSNSGTLTVAGTLYIYGDLIVGNTLTLNITGTMIVFGNIVMSNGGDLTVSGSGTLQVHGNLTGGNGSHITTSGTGGIAVTGGISLGGGGSSISVTAPSTITAGSCTCSGCAGS